MAGSRVPKFGTIFHRIQGLLKSKAMAYDERPLWHDIYMAFPPKEPPLYEREKPTRTVPAMLYPEDIIRSHFYKHFIDTQPMNLSDERGKSTCQKFVEKYLELLQDSNHKDDLFTATTVALRNEGMRLVTIRSKEQKASRTGSKTS